ncbi:MAG: PP2C family protein-serine/threonine phosphatase [Desulfobacterales bacterium]
MELGGEGIALGVDSGWKFAEYHYPSWCAGQLLLLGTDGIWEAENPDGERFGKARLKEIVRLRAADSAEAILAAVMSAVEGFRGVCKSADDITLVVIRRRSVVNTEASAVLETGSSPSGPLEVVDAHLERNAP